jgi:hypothetical protein
MKVGEQQFAENACCAIAAAANMKSAKWTTRRPQRGQSDGKSTQNCAMRKEAPSARAHRRSNSDRKRRRAASPTAATAVAFSALLEALVWIAAITESLFRCLGFPTSNIQNAAERNIPHTGNSRAN